MFAVETAVRRGELVKVKWENVDWNNRALHIPETKTGVLRDMPLSERACKPTDAMSCWLLGGSGRLS
ncbi:Phage integrase family protein [Neptunomonas antarctica]|uniref:Phage integrase family protein n=1 Tax=Neptunomonas antarctica TaxID=619304 RepID=A0A1N7IZV1_9GAMM|nr:Phage integrase family protein [Neptunomonas antarctica]